MQYNKMLDLMLNPNITKQALAEFLRANGYSEEQLRNMLEKSIAPVVYYDQRPLVTGTATAPAYIQFFGARTGTPDNTNMKNSNYILPQDEHCIVGAIRVLYAATGATLSANDWDWGSGSVIAKNLLIKITNNNTVVANLIPGTVFNPDLTTDDQGYYYFSNLFLWKGQTAIDIAVTSQSTALANANLRIEVHGIGLIS